MIAFRNEVFPEFFFDLGWIHILGRELQGVEDIYADFNEIRDHLTDVAVRVHVNIQVAVFFDIGIDFCMTWFDHSSVHLR